MPYNVADLLAHLHFRSYFYAFFLVTGQKVKQPFLMMTHHNGNTATRSSSRGRTNKKELQTTAPNAQHKPLNAPAPISPAHNVNLPSTDQNNAALSTVSNASIPFSEKELLQPSKEQSEHSNVSGIGDSALDKSEVSFSTPEGVGATAGVGDNRGFEFAFNPEHSETLPGQHDDGPFKSSPTDPWHLTFTELKMMRARMNTLEKVEAATLDFAKQLQDLTNKTASAGSTASSNTQKLQEMEEQIVSLKAMVDNQQQTINDLKTIRDDLAKNQGWIY